MAEMRAAEQEHRVAKSAHQEAERNWRSEQGTLKEQHQVRSSPAQPSLDPRAAPCPRESLLLLSRIHCNEKPHARAMAWQEKLRALEEEVHHHKSAAKRLRAAAHEAETEATAAAAAAAAASPVATRSYVERVAAQQEQVQRMQQQQREWSLPQAGLNRKGQAGCRLCLPVPAYAAPAVAASCADTTVDMNMSVPINPSVFCGRRRAAGSHHRYCWRRRRRPRTGTWVAARGSRWRRRGTFSAEAFMQLTANLSSRNCPCN
jgi:hypothetical protein